MTELLLKKHERRIKSYGIPKHMAKEIVTSAVEISNGHNLELCINYAVDLTYGLGLTQNSNGNNKCNV
ncbi:hypothetical protein Q7A53_05790 [Halobacillus rhizosphaerae]|uniref:hypothetical protein n=1 Tax=Halobacillus rhizosphaerae TaxID=3064889 RepID=UPI00398A8F51